MNNFATVPQRSPMRKWLIAAALLLIAFLVYLAVSYGAHQYRETARMRSPARQQWKGRAIEDIARLKADSSWLTNQVAQIQSRPQDERGEWIADNLLLMKDGTWLVYASICAKQDSRIHDLFLACGSDGNWYYSTYHFCVRMISLRIDDQPLSISNFVASYSLRRFDGHSDECLNKTWPAKR